MAEWVLSVYTSQTSKMLIDKISVLNAETTTQVDLFARVQVYRVGQSARGRSV